MGSLKLCIRHSEIPYYIEDRNISIYSIEELAYYLYTYAYFVDKSFFNDSLTDYIENNLKMPKLSAKLKYAIGQNMGFAELAMIVVEGSRYYNEEELKEYKKTLDIIGSKNMSERLAARAGMLFENGKLAAAKDIYQEILKIRGDKAIMSDDEKKNEFYAQVYNGLGKIKARLFYYEEALDEFRMSFLLFPSLDTAGLMINSVLMMKKDDSFKNELIKSLMDEYSIPKETVTLYTDNYHKFKLDINMAQEYVELEKMLTYDGLVNLDEFYHRVNERVHKWKVEYRECD